MEQKTFFGKVLAAILSVFIATFPDFVKRLFNKIPDDLKAKMAVIIQVVENIEKVINYPEVDLLTDIIPGHIDDDFKQWLRKVLPHILEVSAFQKIDNSKSAYLHTVATLLTKELTGSSFGQAAITAEVAYQNLKKK